MDILEKPCMSNIFLKRDTNQALEIGIYAVDFLQTGKPSPSVIERVKLFHTDSVICGFTALALKTNAPTVLMNEALSMGNELNSMKPRAGYAKIFGSPEAVLAEKAILVNTSAVRELDCNGTNFGAVEFGHNDFYTVVIAAAQQNEHISGKQAVKAMILVDEIRGRLCESFSVKLYKIDHVALGAIASIATYGALLGATPEQIEQAIGIFCSQYIPFRAIRSGKELSDSKGAAAGMSLEVAILCMKRVMNGFVGPKDIFRNPDAFSTVLSYVQGESPFDLYLGKEREDFSLMGMHFKFGIYLHCAASAIECIMKLILMHRFLEFNNIENIKSIKIFGYEPALKGMTNPAKRDPKNRNSADHSMVYIVSTLLRKATELPDIQTRNFESIDDVLKTLMLDPFDFSHKAIYNKTTRSLIDKIIVEHGGKSYDAKYPDGIPSSVIITLNDGTELNSDLIIYPSGHARNTTCNLKNLLEYKFNLYGRMALNPDELKKMLKNLDNLENLTNNELQQLYDVNILYREKSIDDPNF